MQHLSRRITVFVLLAGLLCGSSWHLLSADEAQEYLSKLRATHAGQQIRDGNLIELEASLKADPKLLSLRDASGSTLLHHAAIAGNLDAARLLMPLGASAEQLANNHLSPFHEAAMRSHVDILEYFLDHGVDVNSCGDERADVPVFGWSPYEHGSALDYAAQMGAEKSVEFLLSKGANLDTYDGEKSYSALHHAMNPARRQYLIADIEEKRSSQLKIDGAVRDQRELPAVGNEKVIELLVNAGADLRGKTGRGHQEPIHVAAYHFDVDVIRVLLKKYKDKIDVNAPDRFGNTALTWAIRGPTFSNEKREADKQLTIELLKQHGAIELPPNPRRPPLLKR